MFHRKLRGGSGKLIISGNFKPRALVWPITFEGIKRVNTEEAESIAVQAEREIMFQSEDGWSIYGTLATPGDLAEDERVPAVLLLHSSGHDQETYNNHYAIPG